MAKNTQIASASFRKRTRLSDTSARSWRCYAFANGRRLCCFCQWLSYDKIDPYLISKITDSNGKVLSRAIPELAGNEKSCAINERNAFLMDSMLKDVVRYGTATKALVLKRPDIAGKTGTTNDSFDAFAGYRS